MNDPTASCPRLRFPRSRRLLRPSEFRRVMDAGPGRRGRYLVLWLLPGERGFWRFGVVASRKTFPRAVDRARAKRLLREAFRLSVPGLRGGMDAVAVARRAILGAGMPRVLKEWKEMTAGAGGHGWRG